MTTCSTDASDLHWAAPTLVQACSKTKLACEKGKCVKPSAGPDLVALELKKKSAASLFKPGSTVPLQCSWKNTGGTPAGAFSVGVYLGPKGAKPTLVRNFNIKGLAVGKQQSADCSVKLSTKAPAGPHTLHLVVDRTKKVAEQHENNNVLVAPMTIGQCDGGACCDAGKLAFRPHRTKCGGTKKATKATCVFAGKYIEQSFAYHGCSGKSATCSASSANYHWTKPVKTACKAPGKCQVVSGKATCKTPPNLRPTSFSVSPSTVERGKTVKLYAWRENNGGEDAGKFHDAIYLSTSSSTSGSKTKIFEKYNPFGLKAGKKASMLPVPSVTIPSSTKAGAWYVHYHVDSKSAVKESDEKDNWAKPRKITVLDPPANLVVTALSVSPSLSGPKGKITVSFKVQNTGKGTAAARTDRIYLSTNNNITGADKLLGSYSRSALAAGKSYASKVTLTVSSTAKMGSYYLGYWADATNKVKPEVKESDNIRITPLKLGQCGTSTVCCSSKMMFQPLRMACGLKPINEQAKCQSNAIYKRWQYAGCTGKSATTCSYSSSYIATGPWKKVQSCTGGKTCQVLSGKPTCALPPKCSVGICCDTKTKQFRPKGYKCGTKLKTYRTCLNTTKAKVRAYYDGCSGTHATKCGPFYDQAAWVGGTKYDTCSSLEICSVKAFSFCDGKWHQCKSSDACCDKGSKKGATWYHYADKGRICGSHKGERYVCKSTKVSSLERYTRACSGTSSSCSGSYKWREFITKYNCPVNTSCRSDVGKCVKKNKYACSEKTKWKNLHNKKDPVCKSYKDIGSKCTGGKYSTNCAWCSALAAGMCSTSTAQKAIDQHVAAMKSCAKSSKTRPPCSKVYSY